MGKTILTEDEKFHKYASTRPAFPVVVKKGDSIVPGLTIRQFYAGLAMQGILAGGKDFLWTDCLKAADCLIRTLDKAEGDF